MVHHDACPLCSSEKISPSLNCADHFLTRKVFPIFKCTDCGFLFTQDYPGENEIGKYYESDEYLSHSDTSKSLFARLYRLVRNIMLNRKKNLVESISGLKNGSLLDIGSGSGYFASTMKKAGWKVRGIEINDKARDFSIESFGLDISAPGSISSIDSASFDCITLWHVLEHFHDPFSYVSEIKRLLKPEGYCFVALPNSGSFDAAHYSEYWAAYDVPRHLWHFSPETFRLFADRAGFRLEKIKNLPLDVFYISYLSEKYRGSSMPFFKGLIRAKFFALHSILKKEKSSSIIYILRKKH
jgi:SAM-dependent methyltransferase